MHSLYVASVWLHILAAAVWIGGMVFFATVVVPLIRHPDFAPIAPNLIRVSGRRFRVVGWVALAALALTGMVNLWARGFSLAALSRADFWASGFGGVLAHKLGLVAFTLTLSVIHDLAIGPRATEEWRAHGASPRAMRLRRAASWIGRVNLITALLIALFGVLLVRGLA